MKILFDTSLYEQTYGHTPRGRGSWAFAFEHDGRKLPNSEGRHAPQALFEAFIGMTFKQLDRVQRKAHERCHVCGGRKFAEFSGHPGEHLTACAACGAIVDSYFCIGEVE